MHYRPPVKFNDLIDFLSVILFLTYLCHFKNKPIRIETKLLNFQCIFKTYCQNCSFATSYQTVGHTK